MHGKFTINGMFHLTFTYSNILEPVIHKMNMNLYLLFCKYWACGQNVSKLPGVEEG